MSEATRAKTARARAVIAKKMLLTYKELGRRFDDCFEMFDGDMVVWWLIEWSKTDPILKCAIETRGCGHWLKEGYLENRRSA